MESGQPVRILKSPFSDVKTGALGRLLEVRYWDGKGTPVDSVGRYHPENDILLVRVDSVEHLFRGSEVR